MNKVNKYHFLRRIVTLSCLLALLAIPAISGMGAAASPAQDYGPATIDACPPLPPPTGDVVHVSTVTELQNAVNSATSHTTISIADGTDIYPKSCTSRHCVKLTSSGKCGIMKTAQRRQIWPSDTQRN